MQTIPTMTSKTSDSNSPPATPSAPPTVDMLFLRWQTRCFINDEEDKLHRLFKEEQGFFDRLCEHSLRDKEVRKTLEKARRIKEDAERMREELHRQDVLPYSVAQVVRR
jgi:hypothetical protein